MYLPGGHAISREERGDTELKGTIKEVARDEEEEALPLLTDFKAINPVTSVAVQSNLQVARVNLNNDLLPSGKHGATIINCLEAQPADMPFLFEARNTRGVSTTYGQTLDFIRRGEGDLRRLGIKAGEVVAYGAPPGGGAPAALAFLCVGAQTTAAPLAPGES